MKKIALVSLILCLCVSLLTGCTSLSTYLDHLNGASGDYGTYTLEDFSKDDFLIEYGFDADDYGFIEGVKASNKIQRTNAVAIACFSESDAERFVKDVSEQVKQLNAESHKPFIVMNDRRFIFIGNEQAIADFLYGCVSLGTYLDRLTKDDVDFEGTYSNKSFTRDDFLATYNLKSEDYRYIDAKMVSHEELGVSAAIIVFFSEQNAKDFIGAVDAPKAVNEGRVVLIGDELAVTHLLKK